jgi:release factor glutamine methyltransferase
MRNSKQLFQDFIGQLTLEESADERKAMAQQVFEKVLNLSLTDIMSGKQLTTSLDKLDELEAIAMRLNRHEPIQYILGEAEFYGRRFIVNSSVLIPRPETELLVQEVLAYPNLKSVLDIGTGSGCLPITIALEQDGTNVSATDISKEALRVAQENADRLQAKVTFIRHDVLKDDFPFSNLDVVVSNPPYIRESEQSSMKKNVVDFEPHEALFVPDSDPLLFYSALAKKSMSALKVSGMLVVEINEQLGKEVVESFVSHGFQKVAIINDLDGKNRMVKGYKAN